ncbi:hypothetical protein L7F22_011572 [Adiantum nelumboides]|nr:hypothetical protein [Adiantum nelumboides]
MSYVLPLASKQAERAQEEQTASIFTGSAKACVMALLQAPTDPACLTHYQSGHEGGESSVEAPKLLEKCPAPCRTLNPSHQALPELVDFSHAKEKPASTADKRKTPVALGDPKKKGDVVPMEASRAARPELPPPGSILVVGAYPRSTPPPPLLQRTLKKAGQLLKLDGDGTATDLRKDFDEAPVWAGVILLCFDEGRHLMVRALVQLVECCCGCPF